MQALENGFRYSASGFTIQILCFGCIDGEPGVLPLHPAAMTRIIIEVNMDGDVDIVLIGPLGHTVEAIRNIIRSTVVIHLRRRQWCSRRNLPQRFLFVLLLPFDNRVPISLEIRIENRIPRARVARHNDFIFAILLEEPCQIFRNTERQITFFELAELGATIGWFMARHNEYTDLRRLFFAFGVVFVLQLGDSARVVGNDGRHLRSEAFDAARQIIRLLRIIDGKPRNCKQSYGECKSNVVAHIGIV